jgi:hypothetical protein
MVRHSLQVGVLATRPLSHTDIGAGLHALWGQWLMQVPRSFSACTPLWNIIAQASVQVLSIVGQLTAHSRSWPHGVPWSHDRSWPQHFASTHSSQLGSGETWTEPQDFGMVPVEVTAVTLVLVMKLEELETSMLVPVVLMPVVVVVPPWPPVPEGPSTTTLPPQEARIRKKKDTRFMRAS